MIPHGGGDRHLWRLLRTIERAHPVGVAFRHRRAPIVPAGAREARMARLARPLRGGPARFAVVALLGLAPGGHGHRPLTAAAAGAVGALALTGLALFLLVPGPE